MTSAAINYPSKFWETNKTEHTENSELWKRIVLPHGPSVWVSCTGKCISEDTLLNLTKQNRYTIKRVPYAPAKLVSIAFKVDGYEKLETEKLVVTLIDENKPLHYKNVKICSRSDLVIRNTEQRDSKGYATPLVRNGKSGIVFLEGYRIYEDSAIFSLLKKDPIQLELGLSNGRVLFRGGREDRRMYVDILMLISFGDLKGQSYDDVLNNYNIIHKDNVLTNNLLPNLDYKPKSLSKEAEREERVQERIRELHQNILEVLKSRQAVLITPLKDITTGSCSFKYKCLCEEKETCYQYLIQGKECVTCKHSKLKETTEEKQYQDITIDNVLFKRFEYGWVSSTGIVLNNFKKKIAITKGNIKISQQKYNIKPIIAKAFNLPNLDKLNTKGYHVFQVVSNDDFSTNNLVIRTQSEDTVIRKRQRNELRDSQIVEQEEQKSNELVDTTLEEEKTNELVDTDSDEKNKINELSDIDSDEEDEKMIAIPRRKPTVLDVKGLTGKTHSDYPGIVFYENGIYKSSAGTYSYGSRNTSGYYTMTISGKSYKVHRMICFLFNPKEGKQKLSDYNDLEVDHIEPQKYNNHYTNLKWVNPSENRQAGVELNLYKSNKPIIQYSVNKDKTKGNEIKRFKTIKDAVIELHISRKKLSEIAKTQEVYKGFIFVFA